MTDHGSSPPDINSDFKFTWLELAELTGCKELVKIA